MSIVSSPNSSPSLSKLLAGAQLPALPQSAIRLLQLSQDPDNGPAEFAVPIEADPGLTGQILRFVNSSYFGFSREISSVRLAITLVGVRTIKNFALWSAVFSLMPNPKCGQLDLKSLWQDSLRRGLFARVVGKLLGLKQAEDLFTAALLQDMSIPLLAKELPQPYLKLFMARSGGQARLSALEQAQFGWQHAAAAGVMARGWSLSDSFARLIETHHEPLIFGEGRDIGALTVQLSALLPAACDDDWHEREAFLAGYEQLVGELRPVEELLAQVDRDFAEFAPMLKLATVSRTLVDALSPEIATAAG